MKIIRTNKNSKMDGTEILPELLCILVWAQLCFNPWHSKASLSMNSLSSRNHLSAILDIKPWFANIRQAPYRCTNSVPPTNPLSWIINICRKMLMARTKVNHANQVSFIKSYELIINTVKSYYSISEWLLNYSFAFTFLMIFIR